MANNKHPNKQTAEKAETIRQRLMREEREAQKRQLAEMRAKRKADEAAARELAEKKRKAKEEAERKAKDEAERRAAQAAQDAEDRKKSNAAKREKEIERLERQYVLFERAKGMLDELLKAENEGLNGGITYRSEVEKLMRSVDFNLVEAKRKLLNPRQHFKALGIAD